MNRKTITKGLFLCFLPACLAGAFALSACELVVDFDRTRIVAGSNDTGTTTPQDSSTPDVTTTPDAGTEAAADAADEG